jgi:hypothetical protein
MADMSDGFECRRATAIASNLRWLHVPATTFVITHSPSRYDSQNGRVCSLEGAINFGVVRLCVGQGGRVPCTRSPRQGPTFSSIHVAVDQLGLAPQLRFCQGSNEIQRACVRRLPRTITPGPRSAVSVRSSLRSLLPTFALGCGLFSIGSKDIVLDH